MDKWNKLYSEGAKYKPLNEEFLNKLLLEINKKAVKTPKILIDLVVRYNSVVYTFEIN